MKVILAILMIMIGLYVCEGRGWMGKVVGRDRWNAKKYSSNWGRFARKNIKKGRITKSAIKGAVGSGMMTGAMVAYDRI